MGKGLGEKQIAILVLLYHNKQEYKLTMIPRNDLFHIIQYIFYQDYQEKISKENKIKSSNKREYSIKESMLIHRRFDCNFAHCLKKLHGNKLIESVKKEGHYIKITKKGLNLIKNFLDKNDINYPTKYKKLLLKIIIRGVTYLKYQGLKRDDYFRYQRKHYKLCESPNRNQDLRIDKRKKFYREKCRKEKEEIRWKYPLTTKLLDAIKDIEKFKELKDFIENLPEEDKEN